MKCENYPFHHSTIPVVQSIVYTYTAVQILNIGSVIKLTPPPDAIILSEAYHLESD